MRNTSDLARYLRFRLSQLSAENAHHRFEDLSRQFARLRICARILPATGPVSAGGDQGLDFETFRTYIRSSPLIGDSFVGHAGDEKLGFAVSLQKAIVPKIKKDIKAVCEGPIKLAAVYYFCETDIEVAKRHRLQEWSRTEFGIELEIFDGQALSELLTDPSLFWIAVEFLGVPAEMYPQGADSDELYASLRETWLIQDQNVANYADFVQVKRGIRRATSEDGVRPDLPRWIRKMDEFDADPFPVSIRRKAAYEVCVAALRGQNNLTAHLERVRGYVASIEDSEDLSELEDLANLITYCSTAQRVGHFDIGSEEVCGWVDRAIAYTMEQLGTMKWHEAQARMLQVRGQLSLAQLFFGASHLKSDHLDWWGKMLVEAERAPLFPVERFADQLTIIAPFEGDNPRYEAITSKTDELLVKRTGGFAAAEKCRDRALAMFKVENYVGAISQLHRAKIKWFSAENLRNSLLCMELLGLCYQMLGLVYAAKYYLSGLANLALQHREESFGPIAARCLARAANVSYYAGEWFDFLNTARLAIGAECAYVPGDRHEEETSKVYEHIVWLRALSHQFSSEYDVLVESLIAEAVGGQERYEWVLPPAVADHAAISDTDPNVNWDAVQEQLLGRPFGDAGESRTITFHALGIVWGLEFRNDFRHTACAETLASLLQVAIADLANVELALLPATVHILIELTGGNGHSLHRIPNNDFATWKLLIPLKHVDEPSLESGLAHAVIDMLLHALHECSVLQENDLLAALDNAIEDNFYSKALFLGTYANTFRHRWDVETFNRRERRLMKPLCEERPFASPSNDRLPWRDGDGPGYSRERAESFLKNRYEVPKRSTLKTLPKLLENENFRQVMSQLKAEGLLDWELLVIVASVASEERAARLLGGQAWSERFSKLVSDFMFQEEQDSDYFLDPNVFTYEGCLLRHQLNQIGVARTWGLQVRHETPVFSALKRFLDKRYHQRTDDIAHDRIF